MQRIHQELSIRLDHPPGRLIIGAILRHPTLLMKGGHWKGVKAQHQKELSPLSTPTRTDQGLSVQIPETIG